MFNQNDDLMTSLTEAKRIIMDSISPLGDESVSILEAYDRVLFDDVVSDVMLPPADDSAMDGYAVIAADTNGSSKDNPVTLRVLGESRSGGPAAATSVSRGTAMRIMTGALLPAGADAVVKVEDTEEKDGYVKIYDKIKKHKNCRLAGENIKIGEVVLRKGVKLGPADVGILASLNYATVNVYKKARVAIFSTGDELAEVGQETGYGQIRDANSYALYSVVLKTGAIPYLLGITKDTVQDVKETLLRSLEYDVVISSGGVSKGKYDFVKEVYAALGIETQFSNVNVKPGKPCTFAKKGHTLVFGLPGNPVSALSSFTQFVRPALLGLMGAKSVEHPIVNAFLEEDIAKPSGRAHLMRGVFTIRDNNFYVATTGNQKPSVLSSMSKANCLILLPEDAVDMKAGDKTPIQLIDHSEI